VPTGHPRRNERHPGPQAVPHYLAPPTTRLVASSRSTSDSLSHTRTSASGKNWTSGGCRLNDLAGAESPGYLMRHGSTLSGMLASTARRASSQASCFHRGSANLLFLVTRRANRAASRSTLACWTGTVSSPILVTEPACRPLRRNIAPEF